MQLIMNNIQLDNIDITIGSRMWTIPYGWGEVIAILDDDPKPIGVKFEHLKNVQWFYPNGNLSIHGSRCLFWNQMSTISPLPHFDLNAKYLQCSKCGRKTYNNHVNDVCGMLQPNGSNCDGIFED